MGRGHTCVGLRTACVARNKSAQHPILLTCKTSITMCAFNLQALSGMNFQKFKEAVENYTFKMTKPPKDDDAFQQVSTQRCSCTRVNMQGRSVHPPWCSSGPRYSEEHLFLLHSNMGSRSIMIPECISGEQEC